MLPDEALLAVFDFYVYETSIHVWQTLVHVCRRWRGVVFGSPRRLNLRLFCTSTTPSRDTLDVWPAFPILIQDSDVLAEDMDRLVSLVKRSERVCLIELWGLRSPLDKFFAAMQEPYPLLTDLVLDSPDETLPVVPDSFLGGSTPSLISLSLERIPFPGLPKLLLSATQLGYLYLTKIPHSGYISPEALVPALSALPNLGSFKLEFQSPQSHPDPPSRRPPPPTRAVVSFIGFWFQGDSKYLEDLVARIDAPQLIGLYVILVNQIVSDTAQLVQFIDRTPKLKALEDARLAFETWAASVELYTRTPYFRTLDVTIICKKLTWQLLSLQRVFTSPLPLLSTSENLYIYDVKPSELYWLDHIDPALWLELLRPFAAVKNLYLAEKIAPHIVPALLELVEDRTTAVFPILRNIFLEVVEPSKFVLEGLKRFVTARDVTGHPITVTPWDREGTGFDDG